MCLVRVELWNIARGRREGAVLRDLEKAFPDLPIHEEVWAASYELARRARAQGVTAPATNVLIAAWARYHGASIETADSDFELIRPL